MAINSGRIAAGPTATRAATRVTVAPLRNNIPPWPATELVDGGLVIVEQQPQRQGEVIVYSDGANVTEMYVAVDIGSGVLEWKKAAAITGYIDSTTGKPFGL